MEEENICRVCRCEGTPEDPLFYPCLCSGSIKYIHQDCLVQWLQHSKKKYCELCNHPFSFSPVYHESMPQTLPRYIFLVGAFQKMIALSKIWIRYCLVFFSWLVIVPFFTTHIWNLYFPREAEVDFTLKAIAADCFTGALISGAVVINFLGLMSLRDYIVSHAVLREQVGRAVGGQRGRRDARRQAAGAPAEPNNEAAPQPAENPIPAEVHGGANQGQPPQQDDIQFPDFRGWDEDVRPAAAPAQAPPAPEEVNPHVDEDNFDDPDLLDLDDDDSEDEDLEDEDSEDEDSEEEEDVEDEPAAQGNGVNDAAIGGAVLDGPHEELSFEELVGLKGSIFILFENVFWMLLFNAVFLGTFAFVPYATGNVLRKLKVTEYLTQKAVELFMDPSPGNSTLPSLLNTTLDLAANSTGEAQGDVFFETALNRILSILLGYVLLACFILFYMAVSSSILSQDAPFNRYLLKATRFFLVFLKVSMLLILELGLFPLMCGCVIDLISLDLFNSTWASHMAFFHSSPFTFLFVHWFLGNTYMFHFSTFVTLLRDFLRPGVLWFLRNPNDPSFQPMREMIELSVQRHAKRIFISAIFYNSILLVLIYGVIQMAKFFFPSLFPLNIITSDPLSELPIDLLLIHIAFPFGFERVNPIHLFSASVKLWFKGVSRLLCLSSYLLGQDNQDEIIPGTTVATVLNKDIVDIFNDTDPAEEEHNTVMVYCPPHFQLRIGMMLFLFTLSAMFFNMSALFFPILIGRSVFSLFVSRPVHELYTYGVGLCILWGGILLLTWIANILHTSRPSLATLRIHSLVAFKFTYLFFFLGMLIPISIGLLFQLMFVKPFTVAANQSAVFFIFQDWALGALQTKAIHRMITFGPDGRWKNLLDNLSRNGIQGTDMWALSTQLLFPISAALLGSLIVPMAFSLGLLPILGLGIEESTQIFRFSHLGLFSICAAAFLIHFLFRWLDQLQQSIRDEKYLVGQRLHNLDRQENQLHQPSPSPASPPLDAPPPLVN